MKSAGRLEHIISEIEEASVGGATVPASGLYSWSGGCRFEMMIYSYFDFGFMMRAPMFRTICALSIVIASMGFVRPNSALAQQNEMPIITANLQDFELAIKTDTPVIAVQVKFDDAPVSQQQDPPRKSWTFQLPEDYRQGTTKVSVAIKATKDELAKEFDSKEITVPSVDPKIATQVRGGALQIHLPGGTDLKASLIKSDKSEVALESSSNGSDGAFVFRLPEPTEGSAKARVNFNFYGRDQWEEIVFRWPPLPGIEEIKPQTGGRVGDVVTIIGTNLGEVDQRDRIKVTLHGKQSVFWGCEVVSLSNPDRDNDDKQQLSFVIADGAEDGRPLVNQTVLRVTVDGQQSNRLHFRVAGEHWRGIALGGSFFVVCIVIVVVLLSFRNVPVLRKNWSLFLFFMFWDKKTNKYSLSKFQAFGWTVLLLTCYLFLAMGRWLLGYTLLPDFNQSLVILMAVSYGGLVVSRGVANNRAKNDLQGSPRGVSNLFMEGGEVSMPRLQLFGFTIAAWLAYAIYTFFSADVLANGLPDVPQSLLALLGVSQSGYIGGRLVAGQLAVNLIVPRRISTAKNETLKFVLTGTGFVDQTKVMFGNDNNLITAQKLTDNILKFDLEALPADKPKRAPGWYQIIVIPPTGASIVLERAVQIVEPEIVSDPKSPDDDKKKLEIEVRGFCLEDLVCKVGDKVLKRDPKDLEAKIAEQARTGDVTFTAVFVSDTPSTRRKELRSPVVTVCWRPVGQSRNSPMRRRRPESWGSGCGMSSDAEQTTVFGTGLMSLC